MVELNQACHKTPTRSRKRNGPLVPSSSPFRTPIKIPSRHHGKSSRSKPTVSPSPRPIGKSGSSRKSTPCFSNDDRFIPNRRRMNIEMCRKVLLSDETNNKDFDQTISPIDSKKEKTPWEKSLQMEYNRQMRSSLCNVPLQMLDEDAEPKSLFGFGNKNATTVSHVKLIGCVDPYALDHLRVLDRVEDKTGVKQPFDKVDRKIPGKPWKILEAPGLVNDFYLNLISWSKRNILAVIIADGVYLWNANTQQVQHLTSLTGGGHFGTSVSWCTIEDHEQYLAVGTSWDTIQLWDTEELRLIRTFYGHGGRFT